MQSIITAADIDTWSNANPRRAQEILPELIIRLILATSKKIHDFNFPIEKGIQFAGYDGVLISDEQVDFFPCGKSVWEFGTNEDTIGKFREDIEKRHNDPLGVDVTNTVFIFATLKIWNHRTSIEELINESKARYTWKDIRIIDGSKISLWIDGCPAVAVWMSEIIGKHISGLRSAEEYWNDYCLSTTPKLNKDFFLLGRDTQINRLTTWLDQEPGFRVLISESSFESILFILAAFFSLQDEKISILNKVIIVTSAVAWDSLIADSNNDLLLIPVFNFTEEIRCPSSVSAILPVSKFSPISKLTKNFENLELPKYTKTLFNKALDLLGYNVSAYKKIEENTKRSFLPFYRMITNLPTRVQPKWSTVSNTRELVPALLVGGWNSTYKGDREIIEKIGGTSYEEYSQKLNRWISMEDAPVFSVLTSYQLVSVQDLWSFLFDQLTADDIERLRNSAIAVFSTVDPTFDLPEEQWPMASILGKKLEYSALLRQGLIISLIMLSDRNGEENNCNIVSTRAYVYLLVKELLASVVTWQQWNTIAPSLTLLTEASPKAVLEKLEAEVSNDDSELWQLFVSSEDVLMGRNYYTHILWTLETLIWYENYSVRAILVLAKISEKGFKYKLVNSPHNSLYEIFCVWHPQSCLNCRERIEVMGRICDLFPSAGWNLVSSLLPSERATCGTINKPRWHSFEEDFPETVTEQEYKDTVQALIDISMKRVSNCVKQWEIIIKHILLYQDVFEQLEEKCIECCKSMAENDVLLICDLLRERISSFRKFRNANWSAPEEYVQKLEKLLLTIVPNSIARYRYLFKWSPNLLHPIPYNKEDTLTDFKKEQEQVRQTRTNLTDSIIQEFGISKFIDFCIEVEDTSDLSKILAEKLFNNSYKFELLLKIKEKNYNLYTSILWNLFVTNGLNNLIETLIKDNTISNPEKADILCQTPLTFESWNIINELDKEIVCYYWEHIRAFRLESKESEDYFISQLLKYNRPFSVVQIIAFSDYDNTSVIIQVLEKCFELQNFTEANGMTLNSIGQPRILNLFKKIYSNKNIYMDTLVSLEVSFLPYFKYSAEPKSLIRYLEKYPKEYVTLISKAYRRDFDSQKEGVPQEQVRMALDILQLFKKVPGCNNESLSEDIFRNWVETAEAYANELGYGQAFQSCLGNLLSYASVGTDGIFPHEIVRNFFEKDVNTIMINSFLIGKCNQRGIHIVTGGVEEKEISQSYHINAKKIRILFPQTAAILDRLGDDYYQESLYEQKQELMDFRG